MRLGTFTLQTVIKLTFSRYPFPLKRRFLSESRSVDCPFFYILAKDPSLIFRRCFVSRTPVKAVFMSTERKKQLNCQLCEQTCSNASLNSFDWSSHCTHTKHNVLRVKRVFLNKNPSKWKRKRTLFEQS